MQVVGKEAGTDEAGPSTTDADSKPAKEAKKKATKEVTKALKVGDICPDIKLITEDKKSISLAVRCSSPVLPF